MFRQSNLVIEVAAEIEDYPQDQPAKGWSRTQQAASAIQRQLRKLG